jgi:rubrerythrin
VFDLGRFGVGFVASPRHADGLLITGPVSANMRLALQKTYEAVAPPKVVIAVGACAISGGPFAGNPESLDGVGSTAENLKAAIDGETYEFTEMYPPMLQRATASGHRAKRMFGYAVEAEAVHAKLYALALEAVTQGKDLEETSFYLCPVCGHIEFGEPPEACPICGAKASRFVQV